MIITLTGLHAFKKHKDEDNQGLLVSADLFLIVARYYLRHLALLPSFSKRSRIADPWVA